MTKSTLDNALLQLKKNKIFCDCDESILKKVLKVHSKSVSYPKGEIIFDKEHYSPVLCLIVKGEVRVQKNDTIISHLKAGEIFGGAFLYNKNFSFENTVTTLSSVKVVLVEKDGIDELIRLDKSVALNYIAYLSERISFLNSKIEGYTKPSAEEKLLLYLQKNCNFSDGKCEITVSMTELSSVLHMSRASLYRVIDNLEKNEKIYRDGKKIFLCKGNDKK